MRIPLYVHHRMNWPPCTGTALSYLPLKWTLPFLTSQSSAPTPRCCGGTGPMPFLWHARPFLPPGPHSCCFLIASALPPDLCMTLSNHTSQFKRVFPEPLSEIVPLVMPSLSISLACFSFFTAQIIIRKVLFIYLFTVCLPQEHVGT